MFLATIKKSFLKNNVTLDKPKEERSKHNTVWLNNGNIYCILLTS